MDAVALKNISKAYSGNKAVDDVSFKVNQGELFGLIGPDGAGKTSIFRMLTTLLVPDAGTASVMGFDIVKDYKKIRSGIGYMPEHFALYPDLTVAENLNFFAAIFNTRIRENYHLVKDIYAQIQPFKNRRAGRLSGGMKQKLTLCCALIHKPSILFLDEPTTGVDPVSRKEFWEMLQRLKAQQITTLVSTPHMDEASQCDRIAWLQSGKILSIDTPSDVTAAYEDPIYAVKADNMYRLLQVLKNAPGVKDNYTFGEFAHLIFNKEKPETEAFIDFLKEKGLSGIELKRVKATLEDGFIKRLKTVI
ncbi:MAG: ABC transporter ATP-binding protein [Flavobacteriales bacterium]